MYYLYTLEDAVSDIVNHNSQMIIT